VSRGTSGEAVGRLGEEKVGVTAGIVTGPVAGADLVADPVPVPGLVGVDWDAADMV